MQYQLKTDKKVRDAINNLPGHIRQRIKRILNGLKTNPRPATAEELHGDLVGHFRIKLDEWRIVYWIDDEVLIVDILRVGRKEGPEFHQNLRP
jgi:mRNA interferase RelE/StbE